MTNNRISPSAIVNFLACEHLAALDKAASEGRVKRPFFPDPSGDLLAKLGLEHEQHFLERLREEATADSVVEIDTTASWNDASAATFNAMKGGAAVIYQGTFLAPPYLGRADFLCRVEQPSELGAWSYEAVDTKLARSTKASALLQLCFYSEQLALLQGVAPEFMHVELGGGHGRESFRVASFAAYFRKIRSEFETRAKLLDHETSYPEPTERCGVCDWATHCDDRWRKDDHMSLVAGISRAQRAALAAQGVDTLAKLGGLPAKTKIQDIQESSLERVRKQAAIQLKGRKSGSLVHELIDDAADTLGLGSLPEPSEGDVYFDIEGDPYAEQEGLEYLLGYITADGKSQSYSTYWALSRAEEKSAFESFVDDIEKRRKAHPEMHVYHYAPYEPSAMKRLAGRHNTRVEVVDAWARGGLFVDLYRVVRQGIRASVESYSLKKIEALFGFTRTVALRDANASLQAFESWLSLGGGTAKDRTILDTIAAYNQDDCVSTLRLRLWLEERRVDLEKRLRRSIPRPGPKESAPSAELSDHLARLQVMFDDLTKGISADEEERTPNEQGRWLLAQLLEWHRREEKSFWWEYFRMKDLSAEELVEDRNAVGALEYVGEVGKVKRSTIHQYRFVPQEHGLAVGMSPHDPATGEPAGEVIAIDDVKSTIELRRGNTSQTSHPAALLPFEKFTTSTQQESIANLAEWVIGHDFDARGFGRAARDLLMRLPPRLAKGETLRRAPGESIVEQAVRVGLALNAGVLAIQGPPGAGKTFTGAQMILDLVKAGKKVGVIANSHRVITNLLEGVCTAATKRKLKPRIVQKAPEGEGCDDKLVTCMPGVSNADIATMLDDGDVDVVGGTSWLFSNEVMRQKVDVLVVDEAGQLSLANVVAASLASTNIVLLGDPRQLEQPLKGVHPPGVGVSALGHLLGDKATIADDHGIFLPETRRMHPDVCGFISESFYEGRLGAHESTAQQLVEGSQELSGTGLRFVAVDHKDNQSESEEESKAIAKLVRQLTRDGVKWKNEAGDTDPLTLKDILVVAAYNAQVALLRDALPDGARVGTVDKFQGQEGAVAIFSMATSTPADAPRGMEFLYSPNRLNVAISRAKCLAVLVASPALFNVECKTPRQMELANAFCALLEHAHPVAIPGSVKRAALGAAS